jgi:D-aminopeptidase
VKAHEIGVRIGALEPGRLDSITDVDGIRVGHTTLIEGDAVRTGVTAILPTPDGEPCFAAAHRLNGNGEVTGLEWVRESGLLTTPIGLTNTFSVGVVRDAIVAAQHAANRGRWHLPVVGETYDGFLNEIEGMHVRREHVFAALEEASSGAVAEGAVGGGTGMICHQFKGGIGTASRVTDDGNTLGVLVQANHGRRARLTIEGIPVGRLIGPEQVPVPSRHQPAAGSIIVIVATDAPLLPHQCARLAQRAALGIGRTGGAGENSSGDFVVAFATGNRLRGSEPRSQVEMLANDQIDPLFYATIEATEEAIVNALISAETMSGRDGTVHALPAEVLADVIARAERYPPGGP